MSVGRNVRRSYKRDVLRKRVAAMGMPCHLCGRPIDYSLPAGHPMSFEVDEIRPASRGGSVIDPANVAPAHRICNQRKGNRMPGDKGSKGIPIRRSRDW